MALFKSQIATQISGSVGGTTYTRNRSGLIMRGRRSPVQPQTQRQRRGLIAFTTAANRWRSLLTSAQREAWQLWALNTPRVNRLGSPLTLTGQQAYIQRAQLVASIFDAFPTAQLSTPTDAPTIFDRGQTGPISIAPVDIAPWIIDVSFNDTLEWNAPGGGLLIYLANPTNPSRSPFKGPWRLAAWFDGSAIPSSPQSFEPTITADREITTGERISCKAVALYPDGRTASPTYATAIAP